jgi:periplasmic divalent cation tolerance protein
VSESFSVLVTTVANADDARALARAALEARLAACVQIFPIVSHCEWKGELREDAEFAVHMKIRTSDYEELSALVQAKHSYETPEILRFEIMEGDKGYLDWIKATTSDDKFSDQ